MSNPSVKQNVGNVDPVLKGLYLLLADVRAGQENSRLSAGYQTLPSGRVFLGDKHAEALSKNKCRCCGKQDRPVYADGRCDDCVA